MKILIVMGDDHESSAQCAQLRQKILIETASKLWILVGGQLVENADGAAFEHRLEKGETFSLPRG